MDFNKIEQFVQDSFPDSYEHLERTVHWVEELSPNPSDFLKAAAIMHDIERAFRKEHTKNLAKQFGFDHPEFLEAHQKEGAEIAKKFLLENGAEEKFANEVAGYIKNHEVGGSAEKDILMDADTISFFETNANNFIKKLKNKELEIDKVQRKFDFMINRVKTEKAKELIKPFYEKIIKEFEKA